MTAHATTTPRNGGGATPEPADPILYGSDLAVAMRDEDLGWICRALGIVPGRPTTLYGEGGGRKSWFAKAMALAIASDSSVLGRFRFDAERCLYIDNEGGGPKIARMHFQLLARGMDIDIASLEKRLGYIWRPVRKWDGAKAEADLKKLVRGFGLVIVDAWRGCAPGIDENSIAAAGPLDMATEISQATNAAIMFIDHASGKSDGKGANRLRGHTAKKDASNTLLDFKCDDDEGPDGSRMRSRAASSARGLADGSPVSA